MSKSISLVVKLRLSHACSVGGKLCVSLSPPASTETQQRRVTCVGFSACVTFAHPNVCVRVFPHGDMEGSEMGRIGTDVSPATSLPKYMASSVTGTQGEEQFQIKPQCFLLVLLHV